MVLNIVSKWSQIKETRFRKFFLLYQVLEERPGIVVAPLLLIAF